jgi:hypothetical protein
MMRRPLMFLLFLGVLFGFGSAFASMRYRMHHGCHDDRWADARGEPPRAREPEVKAPAPTPQVFVIMPPGNPAPQVVTVPVPTPAPANVAPPATAP